MPQSGLSRRLPNKYGKAGERAGLQEIRELRLRAERKGENALWA
jgi:hypothetical protein